VDIPPLLLMCGPNTQNIVSMSRGPNNAVCQPLQYRQDASAAQTGRTCQFRKTKMCKFEVIGMCAKGHMCPFAHAPVELHELPDLARTKLCKTLIHTGRCDDPKCSYAHNKEQLRPTTTFHKTKMCRFAKLGHCSLGSKCNFAHSPEEIQPLDPSINPGEVAQDSNAPFNPMVSRPQAAPGQPSLGFAKSNTERQRRKAGNKSNVACGFEASKVNGIAGHPSLGIVSPNAYLGNIGVDRASVMAQYPGVSQQEALMMQLSSLCSVAPMYPMSAGFPLQDGLVPGVEFLRPQSGFEATSRADNLCDKAGGAAQASDGSDTEVAPVYVVQSATDVVVKNTFLDFNQVPHGSNPLRSILCSRAPRCNGL